MELLTSKIEKLRTCCFVNRMRDEECSDCISAYDIMNEIEFMNLEAYYFGNVTNSNLNTNQNCLCESIVGFNTDITRRSNNIIDFAELNFEIDNVIYKFDEEISNYLNYDSFVGIITKNENFCSQVLIDNLKTQFDASENGIWIHIWENPVSTEKDIVFIKIKLHNLEESENQANFDILNEEASFSQPFKYKITHRSFAPWDRFGHFPLLPGVHISKNSFHGDNRGFSLNQSVLSDGITARITQSMIVKLGIGKLDEGYTLSSSITRGYRNFKQTVATNYITHPYKEGGTWVYGPANEESDFAKPKGFANTLVNNKITYASIFFEGSDPLVTIAPDIEWYLELAMYTSKDNYLHIKKIVIGKSFPAYEAFIEDKCGKSIFIHAAESDCESNLASNLMNPIPTYNYNGLLKIKINSDGCFLNDVISIEGNNTSNLTVGDYNSIILNKSSAKDCPSIPCQGAYENNGNDKRTFFNCGN